MLSAPYFFVGLIDLAMTRPTHCFRKIAPLWRAGWLCLFLIDFTGTAWAQAQAPLPTVTLTAGMHVIQAEVADRFVTRMTGLMHRPELAPNAGMLFVFEERDKQCMWMKNTLIPLSVAYLGEDGTIINIADMRPHDETSHCAKSPVRFALEMNQGWFAARGLKPGARLQGLERFKPRP